MLAAARDVTLNVERLDDIADDLIVSARKLVGETRRLLYEFALHAGGRELVRGRAAVVLRRRGRRMMRALVTGGSGAIGAAICRELAAQGMQSIVHAHRNRERARALAGEIARGRRRSARSFLRCRRPRRGVRSALEKLLEAGPIQVLVHGAGIYADAPHGRHERGAVDERDRRLAQWLLQRRAAVAAADAAHALGPDRRLSSVAGDHGQSRPGQLRRGQGGAARRGASRSRSKSPRAA